MQKERVLQGRKVTEKDIDLIKYLIAQNPGWGRS